jgi:hypothetical protein
VRDNLLILHTGLMTPKAGGEAAGLSPQPKVTYKPYSSRLITGRRDYLERLSRHFSPRVGQPSQGRSFLLTITELPFHFFDELFYFSIPTAPFVKRLSKSCSIVCWHRYSQITSEETATYAVVWGQQKRYHLFTFCGASHSWSHSGSAAAFKPRFACGGLEGHERRGTTLGLITATLRTIGPSRKKNMQSEYKFQYL